MPRSLSPESRIALQLDSDAGTEQWFYFRSLTMNDERTIGNSYDEVIENQDDLHRSLTQRLVPYLINWTLEDEDGNEVQFDPEQLTAIIDTNEATELAGKLLESGRLSKEEKKSVELPPSFGEASYVKTATPGNAASNSKASKSSVPTVTVVDANTAPLENST